jgi:hypothetical protein
VAGEIVAMMCCLQLYTRPGAANLNTLIDDDNFDMSREYYLQRALLRDDVQMARYKQLHANADIINEQRDPGTCFTCSRSSHALCFEAFENVFPIKCGFAGVTRDADSIDLDSVSIDTSTYERTPIFTCDAVNEPMVRAWCLMIAYHIVCS